MKYQPPAPSRTTIRAATIITRRPPPLDAGATAFLFAGSVVIGSFDDWLSGGRERGFGAASGTADEPKDSSAGATGAGAGDLLAGIGGTSSRVGAFCLSAIRPRYS